MTEMHDNMGIPWHAAQCIRQEYHAIFNSILILANYANGMMVLSAHGRGDLELPLVNHVYEWLTPCHVRPHKPIIL